MKKILLAFISICFLTNLYAQEFAPIGAKWHYTENFAFSANVSYLYAESVADTVIKGKNCKKLINNGGLACGYHSFQDYIYNQDSAVYFYLAATDTFQLLYDFKTKKDSSWIIVFSTDVSSYLDTLKVTVDSISFVNINGYNLKKLWVNYKPLNSDLGYIYPSTIVDKIGDVNYLFNLNSYRVACDGNFSQGLRCYQDPQFGFYNTGIASSCNYTGVNELKSDKIEIYPNPAKDYINFDMGMYKDFQLSVYNSVGQTVLKKQLTSSNTTLNIQSFQSGMYYYQLINNKAKVISGKFLKE